MKVLVLASHQILSPRVYYELKTLISKGYKVQLIVWVRDKHAIVHNLPKAVEIKKIVCQAPVGDIWLIAWLPVFYFKVIRQVRRHSYNAIHCTHLMLLPLAVFLKYLKKTKVIYDAYEIHMAIGRKWELTTLVKRLAIALEKWLVRRVDAVLTVDSKDEWVAQKYKKLNSCVKIIFNVPAKDQRINVKVAKAIAEKYKNHRLVVHLGGVSFAKGAREIIQAASIVNKHIPSVKFVFVGPLKSKHLRTQINEPFIEFLEETNYETALCYLPIAEVGLALYKPIPQYQLLSRGNSRKIFEYMRFSVPVIASEVGEIARVVKEERCGILVDPDDPYEIADAIIYLLQHPKVAKSLGTRGRKAIELKYNWDIEKEKILSIYESFKV